MKFKFKIQAYQSEAVAATVAAFNGQPKTNSVLYDIDLGSYASKPVDMFTLGHEETGYLPKGFKNERLQLNTHQLLQNVQSVQMQHNIPRARKLELSQQGVPAFDIEMETGTGKTYVYIKTMFELNEKYGWSKFIVVVPSIAIREGVYKSFQMTRDHFMETYGKKARAFIYDSGNLNELDQFSSNKDISVMIINTQAFNTVRADARNKAARIIYSERDEFGSRRPIDVIASNNPIIIMDEPQKMGGARTQETLKNFNPLFVLNYSATHRVNHNLVYVLDSLDAYNQKLVKGIQVKGFTVKNLRGTDSYLYLDELIIDPKKPPKARIQLEIRYKNGTKRETRLFDVKDSLYPVSNHMEQYKGFVISEIDGRNNAVHFTNGVVLTRGEVVGDAHEETLRRIQIRETIKSHFEKEASLYQEGIKTLSLFFIDEVAKYRQYVDGEATLGEYGTMFEEEYHAVLADIEATLNKDYRHYLKSIAVDNTHNGYFSVDRKGNVIDSVTKRGHDGSDDITAYELILKNKERLLSFEEPTRFIFSHSALREGWDNPNIFQICTLKNTGSDISRRQEVGRGLRIAVNNTGERMDASHLGEYFYDVNRLTVVATESYGAFVDGLQKEMAENLANRPTQASMAYFSSQYLEDLNHQKREVSDQEARSIYQYLVRQDYIDENDCFTEKFYQAYEEEALEPVPVPIKAIEGQVHQMLTNLVENASAGAQVEDGFETRMDNQLNENFYKKEFQKLWKLISHQYTYRVDFDSEELIKKAIERIDADLHIAPVAYTMTVGGLKTDLSAQELREGKGANHTKTETYALQRNMGSKVKYDLIGKVAERTMLTRGTVVKMLMGIQSHKFDMFKINPEDFIAKISTLIDEEKATGIVEGITYHKTDQTYDSDIFTMGYSKKSLKDSLKAKKHVLDYVVIDGKGENSVEGRFCKALDTSADVVVYAKLPGGFKIPTPVGNYTPDWAIAFEEDRIKYLYFVAETKGSLSSLDLRPIEKAKIDCARKLFDTLSTESIRYDYLETYEDLMDLVHS